jgi:MYXO-CTERM domain-containing protein
LLVALPACGELEPEAEDPPEGIGTLHSALSSINCTETTGTGYVSGKAFTITLVTVDGEKVQKDTANAYYVMAQAAAAKGVNIHVVSGFRTMAEQTYFYNCYVNCNCNNCNLAAKPGYSNHQSGHALDLNTSASGVLSWLNAHGATYGFKRTVPSEDWHWEWWGGGPGGGPCVDKPTYPVLTIKAAAVTIDGQARDLCQLGQSKGIFDLWSGQDVEVDIDVKNSGTAAGRNVTVGLSAEDPFLAVARWNILSDWKAGGSFKINDTDGLQKIGHDSPGQSFRLNLGSISPDETKRAKLVVKGGKLSFGAAGHAEVRAFVAHVDDFYEKKDYGDAPTKNVESYQKQNGGDLKAALQADVLEKEQCDGKDNDCSGQVDDGVTCGSTETPEPLPDPDTPPPSTPGVAPHEGVQAEVGGGCAVGGSVPAPSPLFLLLGLLLAGALRRRS